jgi:hypothetical protein
MNVVSNRVLFNDNGGRTIRATWDFCYLCYLLFDSPILLLQHAFIDLCMSYVSIL